MSFVEATQLLASHELYFVIIGDGKLRRGVSERVTKGESEGMVRLLGLISQKEVANWFNECRLLVIPSYTEGLPNTLLEAMACGTPVLTTPVGSIPGIIKDRATGFIMEDNSPNCIARNIIRALNDPNLEQVAQNARALIEREFTFEKAVGRYKIILALLEKGIE